MTSKTDEGFTHIALVCTDAKRTIDFYQRYADLKVIHDRLDADGHVFWMSDLKRAFAIVFIEQANAEAPLGPLGHLGVCLRSKADVDYRVQRAKNEGLKVDGPHESGSPVGYWAFIQDPDGHTLELSFGQEVQSHVEASQL
jgi:catechol 2,3-dioxygenase-like lactoylglutathione lyase family enzyme